MSRAKNSAYDMKENSSSSGTTTILTSNTSTLTSETGGAYINHGYERWMKLREDWRNGVPHNRPPGSPVRRRPEPRSIDVEEILDRIFNARDGNMTLPDPVPLGKMIDILLDVWEADGLYD